MGSVSGHGPEILTCSSQFTLTAVKASESRAQAVAEVCMATVACRIVYRLSWVLLVVEPSRFEPCTFQSTDVFTSLGCNRYWKNLFN